MEFNKRVSNPMLIGSIELLKAEDSPKYRAMFFTELARAELMAPAIIDPAPEEDGEGNLRLIDGCRVQFPFLIAPDGKKFYMGFTDEKEYKAYVEKNQSFPTFALKFDDYVGLMLRKDAQGNPNPASGIILNPYGANFMVPKDTIANMILTRMRGNDPANKR